MLKHKVGDKLTEWKKDKKRHYALSVQDKSVEPLW